MYYEALSGGPALLEDCSIICANLSRVPASNVDALQVVWVS